MQAFIIRFTICIAFYVIGAYATTDILRLLKGSTSSINAHHCYCPICHNKIALKDQLPIIAYFKNHGACRHCKSPIPVSDLFLEIYLFLLLSGIAIIFDFNWFAFLLCVISYEITKAVFIIKNGARESGFCKNLLLSLVNNIVLFTLIAFLFLLAQIV